jgi:hypothetical protein
MLDRFTHASSEITAAGLSRLLQNGPVRLLLLGLVGYGSLTFGRPVLQAIDPFSLGGGRLLSEFAIGANLDALPDCRSNACTVETVAPAASPPRAVPARWLPDPVLRYPWPASLPFPNSFLDLGTTDWRAVSAQESPDGPEQAWRLSLGTNAGGLRYERIDVPAGGYVSRLVFPEASGVAPLGVETHSANGPRRQALHSRNADTMRRWRAAGNGRLPNGQIDLSAHWPEEILEKDPGAITVSPEGLEFQPMAMPMRVRLPPEMVGRVRAGDPATLRFEAPRGFSPPFDLTGKVTGTRDDVALVAADERTSAWLAAYFHKTVGRAPATDRLTLLVRESLGSRAGASVLVPATAVVRRPAVDKAAEDLGIVWVIAGGTAAPVNVRVGAVDGDQVVVNEIRSPQSGGIHPADWNVLPLERRAQLYRLQSTRVAPNLGLLLHTDARVVARPGAGLRAGDPLRSR